MSCSCKRQVGNRQKGVTKTVRFFFLISLPIIGWGTIEILKNKKLLLYGSTWELYFPLFLLYLLCRCYERDFRTGSSWKDPILLFGVWAGLSFFWNPLRDFHLFSYVYLPALSGYFIFRYLLGRDFAALKDRFFPFYCVAVSLMVLRGLFERFIWHASTTVDSTFMHHNHLAMNVMLGVPLLVYFLYDKRRPKIFYLLNLVIMMLGLVLSFSRSGWIAFILVTVYLLWRFRIARVRNLIIAALLIFIAALSFHSQTRARVVSAMNPADMGISARLSMWKVSLYIFRDNPVMGIGFSNSSYTMNEEYYALRLLKERRISSATVFNPHPHNLFLQVVLSLGTVGFLLLLWIIYKTWLDLHFLENHVQQEKSLVIACKASLLGFIFINLTDTMFNNAQMVLFIFLFLAYIFEWRKLVEEGKA